METNFRIPEDSFLYKYRYPILATIFVAYVSLPAITTGCVYALLNTGVRSNNDQLVSKATGLPVQTASADTVIQNGVMVQRSAGTQLRSGAPAATEVKVANIVGVVESLSSSMTPKQLSSLLALEFNQGGGTVHAKVHGFTIIPEGSGQYIVFDTGMGQFILRGTTFTPVDAPLNLTALVHASMPSRRYMLLGGGYANDCISNCCAPPNNQGVPYGWGCACANPPSNC